MAAGAIRPLFASPSIVANAAGFDAEDGSLVLRSTDPLGAYPITVMHSVRAWAGADPDHPLVAERGTDGAWRSCS
jgi:feruloyl-CoA synthase